MSPLTKIFVVLLVLSSLVLTSSLVVYVNREQNWKEEADKSKVQMLVAQKAQKDAQADATASKSALQEQTRTHQAQIVALTQELKSKDTVVSGLNVQVADLNSKINLHLADIARLTEGLKASQDTQSRQSDSIVEARKTVDELTKRNSELNATVSELNNKLDVTVRDWRFFQEQLTEAQKQIGDLSKLLKDHGIDPKQAVAADVGVKAGAPPINGVVKDVRPIEGIPFATISVGAADSVIKGMRFQIIDRDKGEFLGFLTVDTVEPNEATGRLDGPHVGDVKAGSEARTQL